MFQSITKSNQAQILQSIEDKSKTVSEVLRELIKTLEESD